MYQSLVDYDAQIRERVDSLNSKASMFNEQLFDGRWVGGRGVSFVSNSLVQSRDYFDVLDIFVDLDMVDLSKIGLSNGNSSTISTTL